MQMTENKVVCPCEAHHQGFAVGVGAGVAAANANSRMHNIPPNSYQSGSIAVYKEHVRAQPDLIPHSAQA